jgi:hypothetical protein
MEAVAQVHRALVLDSSSLPMFEQAFILPRCNRSGYGNIEPQPRSLICRAAPHGRMGAGRAKADALALAIRSARRRERQRRMAGPGAGERGCRKADDVIDNFPTTAFGRFATEKS